MKFNGLAKIGVLLGLIVTLWTDAALAGDVRARALITANLTMTQQTGDEVLIGNLATNITVTLPPSPRTGQVVYVGDGYGAIGTGGNVSIKGAAGNINGVNNITLSTAWGQKRCVYTGTQWSAR